MAIINPVIVESDGEFVYSEGCLSIPGWRGETKRSVNVTVKALDCGHYLPEEAPDALQAELLMFLA